ncbi:histidine phosphatase family protein [Mucilaginibacter paludis]|uniref:Phosphoglycerate mutase n=1 Tax=Mucilaginibacter paludis DSM 18603 TaxID=714943 RepID=H1YFC2_9SPHI|nr:histidine phosphatase family protein [Mucilaginibacter paludis]EHQ26261.1 hypothetical protein Mucpa_2121 [Mucilaginibacter paludis DSM 18603]
MKRAVVVIISLIVLFMHPDPGFTQSAHKLEKLKIVIIRHGEKPPQGDNLNCQGLNRAMQLPAVIYAKFGIPDYVYVPELGLGESTQHARMFQTVLPLAAKYNLTVNTVHQERDSVQVAADFKAKKGTILMVWEHKAIASIVRSLGVDDKNLRWPDSDFDSIWIITFPKGVPTLTKDKQGLKPSADCHF